MKTSSGLFDENIVKTKNGTILLEKKRDKRTHKQLLNHIQENVTIILWECSQRTFRGS